MSDLAMEYLFNIVVRIFSWIHNRLTSICGSGEVHERICSPESRSKLLLFGNIALDEF
jgi:hypothetical protein